MRGRNLVDYLEALVQGHCFPRRPAKFSSTIAPGDDEMDSPKIFFRTASVETPDCAQRLERSKKNCSPASKPSRNANLMKTGSSARAPLGTTPKRSPVMVICTNPQQTSTSSLVAYPWRTTL